MLICGTPYVPELVYPFSVFITFSFAAAEHPMEAFVYASKHGYPELRDEVVPRTLNLPLNVAKKICQGRDDIFVDWVRSSEHIV
jgi:hypothetical protein